MGKIIDLKKARKADKKPDKNNGKRRRKSAKVLMFTGVTTLDRPASQVLTETLQLDLQSVVVLGFRKDGNAYFSTSIADGGTVLWLVECMKKKLLSEV